VNCTNCERGEPVGVPGEIPSHLSAWVQSDGLIIVLCREHDRAVRHLYEQDTAGFPFRPGTVWS